MALLHEKTGKDVSLRGDDLSQRTELNRHFVEKENPLRRKLLKTLVAAASALPIGACSKEKAPPTTKPSPTTMPSSGSNCFWVEEDFRFGDKLLGIAQREKSFSERLELALEKFREECEQTYLQLGKNDCALEGFEQSVALFGSKNEADKKELVTEIASNRARQLEAYKIGFRNNLKELGVADERIDFELNKATLLAAVNYLGQMNVPPEKKEPFDLFIQDTTRKLQDVEYGSSEAKEIFEGDKGKVLNEHASKFLVQAQMMGPAVGWMEKVGGFAVSYLLEKVIDRAIDAGRDKYRETFQELSVPQAIGCIGEAIEKAGGEWMGQHIALPDYDFNSSAERGFSGVGPTGLESFAREPSPGFSVGEAFSGALRGCVERTMRENEAAEQERSSMPSGPHDTHDSIMPSSPRSEPSAPSPGPKRDPSGPSSPKSEPKSDPAGPSRDGPAPNIS